MLLLQTLVITCGVVLPTLSIPVGNTVAEISKDAARKHNYLGLTADDRLVASNTKPSESSNQELEEVVPLEAGSSGASNSNEVTQGDVLALRTSTNQWFIMLFTSLLFPESF
ncbi:hypothetical protein PGTUg99_011042 [Puccinia graminis f. sp. tritici]|uniref:Uncharacterized protein n=1 Tax=Puccinia graminis f. sp. tritici TaxID=56615 RepID=A0A5B0SFZ6_PUCGR|nr:hypothetical protein PGTUg99_011042 [Puccinia graminis f. sp. tritici]